MSVFAFHSPAQKAETTLGPREQQFFNTRQSILLEHFNLQDRHSLPGILFFQVSNDKVIAHCYAPLVNKTVEGTFDELKLLLKEVVDSVSRVTPANSKNSNEIFSLASNALQRQKNIQRLKVGAKGAFSLAAYVEILRSLIQ